MHIVHLSVSAVFLFLFVCKDRPVTIVRLSVKVFIAVLSTKHHLHEYKYISTFSELCHAVKLKYNE